MRFLLLALFSSILVFASDTGFDNLRHLAEEPVSSSSAVRGEEEQAYDSGAYGTPETSGAKVYLSILDLPDHLFKGQIFSVTLRTVPTSGDYEELLYRFSGARGVKLLNSEPERRYRRRIYQDRFYFKVTDEHARLPDITPVLTTSDFTEITAETFEGPSLDVTVLNPPGRFSGVLAKRFRITHTKTTSYDRRNNILVFMADANESDLGDFHIPGAGNQNFESLRNGIHHSEMTYYVVLPKTTDMLVVSYFNLDTRRFERIRIPIVVDDDSVSTQSDLKPTAQGHNLLKTVMFGILAGLFLLLFIYRRRKRYLVAAVAAAAYAAWLGAPIRHICIKQGSEIYLLPMRNATVFEIAPTDYELEVQGHIRGYTKVKLHNDKIGWVKDEDTCTN